MKSLPKCCYLLILWMLFSGIASTHAQASKIDSLQQRISSTPGEEKATNLLLLSDELMDQYPDSCLNVSLEALKLADSLKNPELIARANYYVGVGYQLKKQYEEASAAYSKSVKYAVKEDDYKLYVKNMVGQAEVYYQNLLYDSARYSLEMAKAMALKHNYTNSLPVIYNNLAKISDQEGNLTGAIEGYLKAAELFIEQDHLAGLAVAYHNIGTIYLSLKNYQDAIYYIMLAADINKRENYLPALNENYNTLGIIYSDTDSLLKARYYYDLVIETARKNKDEHNMAMGYLNLANLLRRQGVYEDAKKYYDSSIYYCEKNNIIFGIILSKLNLGNYYNTTGNYKSALHTFNTVKRLIANYDLPDVEATLYGLMSKAFKNEGIYDSALYYYEMYHTITDSIAGQETREKVLSLEKKYQSERKAREIVELQKSILGEKSRSRFFIATSLFAVLMLISLSFVLFARRRAAQFREQLSQQENQELKNTMELRNQELVSKALMVSNLNEQLEKINTHVQQIKPSLSPEASDKLVILVRELEINLPDHAWHEFETRFEQVHQGFFNRLLSDYPDLTPTELKICSLLRLNMSTKDIALLTNRSIGTVDNIRSCIRRRLKLDNEANLTSFLLNL
ncbi:MAG: tetratricopeptide repeat protein [Clostridia bacterium]|nr:tetratricopeptide repeat protein [Clostridia bacterium]